MKSAILIGATGLVGEQVLDLLLSHPDYTNVKVFVRRSTQVSHPKLTEHIIEFDKPDTWRNLVEGDVLFSTLGTTLKKAGSKEKQYEIDYTFQYNFAKAAADNGVPNYALVSSRGADAKSSIFYLRMKGELELAIRKLPFTRIIIARPNLLIGSRTETRKTEKISGIILRALNSIGILRNQKPIKGSDVARALVHANFSMGGGVHILPSHMLDDLADS